MASQTVTNPTDLRIAIQQADTPDIITLDSTVGPYSSVGSLAKKQSPQPPIPIVSGAAGYTIDGDGSTINDTRIYQNNIDGPAPGTVTNLTLNYTTAAANTNAILRATEGTYNIGIDTSVPYGTGPVSITGNHSGWAGNSGVYMSLNSQTPNNYATTPSTAQLNLNKVTVDVEGQAGFNPADLNSGTAFLQSWNNSAGVNMEMTTFDEAGFRNSFHFATFSPTATSTPPTNSELLGEYNFKDVTFTRSANQTVRKRGNVLESVKANFDGTNTFENGSFLDISGNVSQITFVGGSLNNFHNIPADGYGIRVSGTSPSGQTLSGTTVTSGAMFDFTGPGLPLKYVNSADGAFTTLPAGIGTQYSINGANFSSLIAGGQGNDVISGNVISDWINGDSGNDSINSGSGNDFVLGGDGNDTIIGNGGNDTLNGGAGIDTVSFAGGSAVTVNLATGTATGQGNDVFSNFEDIYGSSNNDTLIGDSNANSINGNGGNDTINGGLGNDTLTGGAGQDRFQWFIGQGTDNITDFNPGTTNDFIVLQDTFTNTIAPATLLSSDYQGRGNLGAIQTPADSNKVVRIGTGESTTTINNFTKASFLNAYVLILNTTEGFGQLYYDADWGDTAGRELALNLTNITGQTALNSILANRFQVV
jgi:Ca2+-binding RTX toxin-like protein